MKEEIQKIADSIEKLDEEAKGIVEGLNELSQLSEILMTKNKNTFQILSNILDVTFKEIQIPKGKDAIYLTLEKKGKIKVTYPDGNNFLVVEERTFSKVYVSINKKRDTLKLRFFDVFDESYEIAEIIFAGRNSNPEELKRYALQDGKTFFLSYLLDILLNIELIINILNEIREKIKERSEITKKAITIIKTLERISKLVS